MKESQELVERLRDCEIARFRAGVSPLSRSGASAFGCIQLHSNLLFQGANARFGLIQENRSFDHYFGQMTAYRRANGVPINGSPPTTEDESFGLISVFLN
jgi:hypothetical protein